MIIGCLTNDCSRVLVVVISVVVVITMVIVIAMVVVLAMVTMVVVMAFIIRVDNHFNILIARVRYRKQVATLREFEDDDFSRFLA